MRDRIISNVLIKMVLKGRGPCQLLQGADRAYEHPGGCGADHGGDQAGSAVGKKGKQAAGPGWGCRLFFKKRREKHYVQV